MEARFNKYKAEEVKDGQIVSISKQRIIEKMTHEKEEDSEFYRTVLYTYKWYFTEIEMFTLLLERFMVVLPLCISTSERKALLETVVPKIQIKVLIFIKDWFKLHSMIIKEDIQIQKAFLELLLIIISYKDSGKWVNLPISQLINSFESLIKDEKTIKEQRKPTGRVTCLSELFVPVLSILDYAHFTAKQLCTFDLDNLKRVKMSEFYKKAWTKPDRHIHAPNLTYIAEMSTKLSRFTSYLVLMNKKDSVRVMMYEYILELCDNLIRLKNFNSAFSIYLGIASQAVQRLKELIEPSLGKEYIDMLRCLKKFFSPSNNMEHLRARQNEAKTPAVPYLGIYLGDLNFLEELPDYLDKGQSVVNFKKSKLLFCKITKILSYKESYGFHKADRIYNFIRDLPAISEEKIYELSFQVLR